MSILPLMGMVQALVTPGRLTVRSISAMSRSYVMPGRHSSFGLSVMVVSNMSSGAGSVAVLARPALPSTISTSGNDASTLSCQRMVSRACAIEMPGTVVGMNSTEPSCSCGMNSLPSRRHGRTVAASTSTAPAMTIQGRRVANPITGRYAQRSARFSGFRASGLILPLTR